MPTLPDSTPPSGYSSAATAVDAARYRLGRDDWVVPYPAASCRWPVDKPRLVALNARYYVSLFYTHSTGKFSLRSKKVKDLPSFDTLDAAVAYMQLAGDSLGLTPRNSAKYIGPEHE